MFVRSFVFATSFICRSSVASWTLRLSMYTLGQAPLTTCAPSHLCRGNDSFSPSPNRSDRQDEQDEQDGSRPLLRQDSGYGNLRESASLSFDPKDTLNNLPTCLKSLFSKDRRSRSVWNHNDLSRTDHSFCSLTLICIVVMLSPSLFDSVVPSAGKSYPYIHWIIPPNWFIRVDFSSSVTLLSNANPPCNAYAYPFEL